MVFSYELGAGVKVLVAVPGAEEGAELEDLF